MLLPPFRILLVGVEVQARPAFVVIPEDELFPRLVLFGYVVWGVAFDFEFSAPDECGLETGDGVGFVPFGSAQVAEEALASQPEAFAVGERFFTGG